MHRLGHPFLVGAFADLEAHVALAVSDRGPTIIDPGFDQVQFVPALGAVLDGVDPAGRGLARHALRVAVADGVELGPRVGSSDEGVVVGHASVVVEADDAARRVAQVLGAVGLAALTGGDEEVAVGEQQP